MTRKKFNSMALDDIFSYINRVEVICQDLVVLNKQGTDRPTEYRVLKFKKLMEKLGKTINWS